MKDYDLITPYKSLEQHHENPDDWNDCPACHAKPKLWLFDNGRFAACKCYSKYDKKNVSAISVGEYYRKHNSLQGYPNQELQDNWNKHTIVVRRKLIAKSFTDEDMVVNDNPDFLPF